MKPKFRVVARLEGPAPPPNTSYWKLTIHFLNSPLCGLSNAA